MDLDDDDDVPEPANDDDMDVDEGESEEEQEVESEHENEPPLRHRPPVPPTEPDYYTFTLFLGTLKFSNNWTDLFKPAAPGGAPRVHPNYDEERKIVLDPVRTAARLAVDPAFDRDLEDPAYRFGHISFKQKMIKVIKMVNHVLYWRARIIDLHLREATDLVLVEMGLILPILDENDPPLTTFPAELQDLYEEEIFENDDELLGQGPGVDNWNGMQLNENYLVDAALLFEEFYVPGEDAPHGDQARPGAQSAAANPVPVPVAHQAVIPDPPAALDVGTLAHAWQKTRKTLLVWSSNDWYAK
ncbi:hypothetical protein HDU96_000653 [Phlyctochytrium bullatum]|nr:hypothetical protein HDU96_000653 [Phlyctochytrium bullatum]